MKTSLVWGAALIALGVAGCAQQPVGTSREARKSNSATIAQIGFGSSAKYVTCPMDGCAQPTQKTIALDPPVVVEHEVPPRAAPPALQSPPAVPAMAAPAALATAASAPVVPLVVAPAPAAPLLVEAPAKLLLAKAVAPVDPEFVQAESSSGRQRVFIGFPSGSARLTKEAKAKLGLLAPQVLGAERVVIKGRTDERGNADSNDRLALRRAMAVYEYLRRTARATDKPFKLLAKGACCYIARNITEDGRAANRRAEIDFVTPMQAAVTPPRRTPSKGQPS